MIIRKATVSDIGAILQLIKELAVFEKEPNAVEISETDLLLHGFQKNPFFKVFVAEINNNMVGMALFYYRFSTWKGKTIHLEDLIVKQEYRNSGIGKALYKKVIKQAVSENIKRVEWAVLNWNHNAINFYKSTGAKVFSDWRIAQFSEKEMVQFLKLT